MQKWIEDSTHLDIQFSIPSQCCNLCELIIVVWAFEVLICSPRNMQPLTSISLLYIDQQQNDPLGREFFPTHPFCSTQITHNMLGCRLHISTLMQQLLVHFPRCPFSKSYKNLLPSPNVATTIPLNGNKPPLVDYCSAKWEQLHSLI